MIKSFKKYIPVSLKKKYYRSRNKRNYKGDAVACVICDSKFKVFRTYGLGNRINAECHNCGSLERHRLIWKYLHERTGVFKTKEKIKILHFGPERFFYNAFDSVENIEYVPCDLHPERYDFNGKSKLIKVDITDIPFKDNTFDFILCNHVLEHIPDDHQAMKELYRVMKKDAFGIFQVPLDDDLEITYEDFSITSEEAREKAFGQIDHVRIYGLDYKQRLENAGFNVCVDDYVRSFDKSDIFKYGLSETEMIYNCSKKLS
nr:class I SAM-dependent methyltransferase [uncultured Psychroserpens sp.]